MSSAENKRLFRKVALERLSSPDRLDSLLPLQRARTPLIWAGMAMVAATALYWGLAGSVEQKVSGRCVLISPSGVAEVTAGAAGLVSNLFVKVGDRVEVGQEIARILRSELFQQIEQARARLAELEQRSETIRRFGTLARAQGHQASGAESATIAEQSSLIQERSAVLGRRLETERALFQEGLVTRQTVLDTEQALSVQKLERERMRDRLQQLKLRQEEEERQRNRELVTITFQVNEARRSLGVLLDIERQSAPVVSPYAGRVIEVKAQAGASVGYGAELVQLERLDQQAGASDIEAAIYVPGGEGKLVSPGMAVEIVPDYVKRQEFGFLRGRVEQVSEYPASAPGMRPLVQNDNLLKELSGPNAPIFARASLVRRADQSFQWSAAAENPPAVRSGALCRAEVTVGTKRPIGLVVPAIRKWLGLV